MKRDYYETLGISKSASDKEIKSAYRKLALKYHPDRNQDDPDAELKFKEAAEAYDTLSDQKKRASYDRFGHSAGEHAGFDPSSFDFESFFGGFNSAFSRGRSSESKPPSVIRLSIDFKEAIFGSKKKIRIPMREACATCNGTRCKPGTSMKTCGVCKGRGTVNNGRGFVTFVSACRACGGEGVVPESPCVSCSGSGFVSKNSVLEINIPAGVDSDDMLRLAGKGAYDRSTGRQSDLFIRISVKRSEEFEREGNNIHSNIDIGFVDAIIGGKIKINTVHGEHYINISECTQPGTVFRLKGKGVKSFGANTVGDHFVNTNIKIPSSVTKKQKEILSKFSKG